LSYRILIKEEDGDYSEETTYCDGTDPTTKANRYCTIPMSVLVGSPYLLT
jgi:hypothetical protein